MRVLAIQLKRIGDLVLTEPALAALGGDVTLVIDAGCAGLAPAFHKVAEDVLLYDKRHSNSALWRRIIGGRWDRCIDFTGGDRAAMLTLASRASRRIIARDLLRRAPLWRRLIYNAPVETSLRERHTVDFYLDHIPATQSELRLDFPEVSPISGDYIVVHPGSARREKYWPADRWREVIAFCETRMPCVVTGGKGDPVEDAHLAEIAPARNLAGQFDLLQTGALLRGARLVVSVDTGPMHLAAATPAPQIALFGPTNPFHWRPRKPGAIILQNDRPLEDFTAHATPAPMDAISTRTVIRAIEKTLAQGVSA